MSEPLIDRKRRKDVTGKTIRRFDAKLKSKHVRPTKRKQRRLGWIDDEDMEFHSY